MQHLCLSSRQLRLVGCCVSALPLVAASRCVAMRHIMLGLVICLIITLHCRAPCLISSHLVVASRLCLLSCPLCSVDWCIAALHLVIASPFVVSCHCISHLVIASRLVIASFAVLVAFYFIATFSWLLCSSHWPPPLVVLIRQCTSTPLSLFVFYHPDEQSFRKW